MSTIIKPINRDTVHRICSGQVVLSLAIAVKELVENAIDASATNIEIRLKDYGSELIEVLDNGTGVTKENFQALTQKHCTSKIKSFEDLEFINTLGFRGEALSSLCALADVSIITRHKLSEYATKIVYDHNGLVTSETPAAREEGTTVIICNLFSSLPVRRKEFIKNLKREFSKMCQLLYAYCLVSKCIKFTCTNQTNKNSKQTVVSTSGAETIKENIICVFGPKQLASLIEIELALPDCKVQEEYGIELVPGEEVPFTFDFIISSVEHGSGRGSSDRQFFFINGRPCEPTKVNKLINEIYKQFNSHQFPFVYLNIKTGTSQVDVNVTPDKRQIFMEKEKVLLATIKASLLDAFKEFPSTYKMQNLTQSLDKSSKEVKKSFNSSKRNAERNDDCRKPNIDKTLFESLKKRPKIEENSLLNIEKDNSQFLNDCSPTHLEMSDFNSESQNSIHSSLRNDVEEIKHKLENDTSVYNETESSENLLNVLNDLSSTTNIELELEKELELKSNSSPDNLRKVACKFEKNRSIKNKIEDFISILEQKEKLTRAKDNQSEEDIVFQIDSPKENKPDQKSSNKKITVLNVSLDSIKNALTGNKKERDEGIKVSFRSKISPESNKTAEQELQKHITKDMFKDMEILGQFNLGFIITKLKNDLFIIDQHATDEKYNFEQLQMNTELKQQVLVIPKPLELTAANESVLIENEEIFKKNGFTFKIDHEANCTKKVLLTSIPLSKNCIFGKDDIDEMLFMLQDSNLTMCRPSKVRSMLASRACRKSVMVGDPLSKNDMKRLVTHMGEIEQPWNCPHGRPTMRHLINLGLIDTQKM